MNLKTDGALECVNPKGTWAIFINSKHFVFSISSSNSIEYYLITSGDVHIGSFVSIRYTYIDGIHTLVLILQQKAIYSHRYKSSLYFATNDQTFGRL